MGQTSWSGAAPQGAEVLAGMPVGALGDRDRGTDKLPAGTAAGLVLTVDHLRYAARPKLELSRKAGEPRQSLTLSPGVPSIGASRSLAGPGARIFTVDPGTVGYPVYSPSAPVTMDSEGRSDAFVPGCVIHALDGEGG